MHVVGSGACRVFGLRAGHRDLGGRSGVSALAVLKGFGESLGLGRRDLVLLQDGRALEHLGEELPRRAGVVAADGGPGRQIDARKAEPVRVR